MIGSVLLVKLLAETCLIIRYLVAKS